VDGLCWPQGLDTQGPKFLVEVLPGDASLPPDTLDLRLRDPLAPSARKRDERIQVHVTSDAPDLVVDSVRLAVGGIGADGGISLGEPLPVTPTTSCERAYCGLAEVDLSQPEMAAFRGRFRLVASGADRFLNSGSGNGEVEVTRWKWEFDAHSPIVTPPALGTQGIIYVATRSNADGGVVAIRPNGSVWWTQDTEPPTGQLAVAAESRGRSELLYMTMGQAMQKLSVWQANGGRTLGGCSTLDGGYQAEGLALGTGLTLDGGVTDIVTSGFHNAALQEAQLVGIRWHDASVGGCFWGRQGTDTFMGVVANDNHFYFATHQGAHFTIQAQGSSNIDRFECFNRSRLAMADSTLVGIQQGSGKVYSSSTPTSTCTELADRSREGLQELTSAPVVDARGRILYGKVAADGGTYLARASAEGAQILDSSLTQGRVEGAPVLGQGGLVYTATSKGALQVWTDELKLAWGVPAEVFDAIKVPATLDCARDIRGAPLPGRPGVWYVPHGSRLLAVIVDSRGLDTHAKWPKYQHDPRNTGNAAVELAQFACP
jgi:hypothetical protein